MLPTVTLVVMSVYSPTTASWEMATWGRTTTWSSITALLETVQWG